MDKSTSRDAVILVHGLWMPGIDMALLGYRLRHCGFRTFQFHYRSLSVDLADNAARLKGFSQEVAGDTIHYVGHSMGGLVIRRMLADYRAPRLGRVVTLGTPHQYSSVGRCVAAVPRARWLLGRSASALCAPELPSPDYPVGTITGTLSLGVGRLITSLPEPNDGTVALEEAGLEGATDTLALRVSHMGMLFSGEVAQQVCHFLKVGRFRQG